MSDSRVVSKLPTLTIGAKEEWKEAKEKDRKKHNLRYNGSNKITLRSYLHDFVLMSFQTKTNLNTKHPKPLKKKSIKVSIQL